MVEKPPNGHEDNSDLLREGNLQVHLHPDLSDESVGNYLRMVGRSKPDQLPTAVQAVRQVWAYAFGGWVEAHRLQYVNTVLAQLQISEQIITVCLSMGKKLRDDRDDRNRQQAKEAAGVYALEAQADAEDQNTRIAKAQAEQAEALRKIEGTEKALRKPRTESEETRRKAKWKKADEEVQRLVARKQEVLTAYGRFGDLSDKDKEEYIGDENRYNQRIREAKDRRMQFE